MTCALLSSRVPALTCLTMFSVTCTLPGAFQALGAHSEGGAPCVARSGGKAYIMRAAPLLVPIALGGIAVATMVARPAPAHSSHIYSVAAARSALLRRSAMWVGRTLSVHGRLDGCPPAPEPCVVWQPRLFDVAGPSLRTALPVELVLSDPQPVAPLAALQAAVQTALQGLPLLGALVSARHMAHWGTVATYRIRLAALLTRRCATGTCDTGDAFDGFTCDIQTCYKVLLLEPSP